MPKVTLTLREQDARWLLHTMWHDQPDHSKCHACMLSEEIRRALGECECGNGVSGPSEEAE